MKRIVLTAVALTLSTGAAFAATPSNTPAANPVPKAQTSHHDAAPAGKYQRVNQTENRETKALNLLEAKGYASFSNFKPDGHDYSATVAQNGHNMTVMVDPVSGRVTTQS
jgi:hypothetical protein